MMRHAKQWMLALVTCSTLAGSGVARADDWYNRYDAMQVSYSYGHNLYWFRESMRPYQGYFQAYYWQQLLNVVQYLLNQNYYLYQYMQQGYPYYTVYPYYQRQVSYYNQMYNDYYGVFYPQMERYDYAGYETADYYWDECVEDWQDLGSFFR